MAAIQPTELYGNYPALVTPIGLDGHVETMKLQKITESLLETDIRGLLACGTTGQSATLDHDEQIALVEMIANIAKDYDKQLIANAGSNNTKEAIKLQRGIEERIGPTTFLHVTGYYNNPNQEGIIKHFRKLLEQRLFEESNIILYNVKGRTSSNIEDRTAVYLSTLPGIIAIKEASGDINQVKSVIENTDPDEFRVLSGEDHLVAKIMRMGGYGVISATANIAPVPYNDMVAAGLKRTETGYAEADRIQEWIMPLKDVIFNEKNPIPLAEVFGTGLRSPMTTYDESLQINQEVMNHPRIKNNPDFMAKLADRGIELRNDKQSLMETIRRYTPKELGMDYRKYLRTV